ncbi:hypothetical protein HELRODRAFT_181180 [Helobdella robusta]|uniref:Uncharacterized protein n=1 Tax=Helobdella robusta TaxID=6412 RepID=T1FGQ1_HELRO|nr:hypothetical protein HELRODRAFT_181180 [Helobdella robusta]ESN93244.1 hypothetical protein HELRODRAFT_181180 [Helobdella robusta]
MSTSKDQKRIGDLLLGLITSFELYKRHFECQQRIMIELDSSMQQYENFEKTVNEFEAEKRLHNNFSKPLKWVEMKVSYQNLKIEKYIPLPMRFIKYGHHHKISKSKETICAKGGNPRHQHTWESLCQNMAKCYHCKQRHETFSKEYQKFKLEKEII